MPCNLSSNQLCRIVASLCNFAKSTTFVCLWGIISPVGKRGQLVVMLVKIQREYRIAKPYNWRVERCKVDTWKNYSIAVLIKLINSVVYIVHNNGWNSFFRCQHFDDKNVHVEVIRMIFKRNMQERGSLFDKNYFWSVFLLLCLIKQLYIRCPWPKPSPCVNFKIILCVRVDPVCWKNLCSSKISGGQRVVCISVSEVKKTVDWWFKCELLFLMSLSIRSPK